MKAGPPPRPGTRPGIGGGRSGTPVVPLRALSLPPMAHRRRPRRGRRVLLTAALGALLGCPPIAVHAAPAVIVPVPSPGPARSARGACEQAGAAAEAAFGVPSGLLLAIGRVETGRYSQALGRLAPWPWAVDVAGTGALFPNRSEALAVARGAVAAGQRNVDLGCFQVNLGAHPDAFTSLRQALDPMANASYAARFLVALHARLGDWAAAAAAYHSETAALGAPYLRAVLRSWTGPGGAPGGMIPAAFATAASLIPRLHTGWVVISPVAGPRIITPGAPVPAGSGPVVHDGWPAGLPR